MTYKYNLVSLDFDTVKQELIDDEQNKALEYLDTMSKEELNDIHEILEQLNSIESFRENLKIISFLKFLGLEK